MESISASLGQLSGNGQVPKALFGLVCELRIKDAGVWLVEFSEQGTAIDLALRADRGQADFYISVEKEPFLELLRDSNNVWDFVFHPGFGTNKPLFAGMVLEVFFPGAAAKSLESKFGTRPSYASSAEFFETKLREIVAQPRFMSGIKSTYNIEILGLGNWSLDVAQSPPVLEQTLLQKAKCIIRGSRSAFDTLVSDPVQVIRLVITGEIEVSHPCRARQLFLALWRPEISTIVGESVMLNVFDVDDTCEEAATGEMYHTYVQFGPDHREKLYFVDVNGVGVWQGDIVLGNTADLLAVARAVEDPSHVEGIRIINWGNPSQYIWPNKTLYYQIASDFKDAGRMDSAIAYFVDTGISFVNSTGSGNYVKLVNGDGCHTSAGMQGGEQELTLSESCSVGNLAHELCHNLGLFHEQSRFDRDDYVEIIWDNIQDGKSGQFDKQLPSVDAYITLPDVISQIAAPPSGPTDGSRYLIAVGATGDWLGKDNNIAQWATSSSSWVFTTPATSDLVRITSTNSAMSYDGTSWQAASTWSQDVGSYDYGSIMHYGKTSFGKKENTSKNKTTIKTKGGEAIGQRSKLSAGDIATLKSMYP